MTHFWNIALQFYLLTSVAASLGLGLHWVRSRKIGFIGARAESLIHCGLIVACFVLLFVPSPLGSEFKFEPVIKQMNADSFKEFDHRFPHSPVSVQKIQRSSSTESKYPLLLFLFSIAALSIPLFDLFRLKRLVRTSLPWKTIGKVNLAFSDSVDSPFSSHWAGRAWVIVPTFYCGDRELLKISVAHELQHHRQRDTLWLYVFFLLRICTPFHPLRAYWLRVVEQAQEEACDQALVDQKRVDRRVYARCLLEVAENSVGKRRRVACAANFYPFSDRNNLKRRIEKMYEKRKTNKKLAWGLSVLMGILLTGAAFASGNWVQDQRVSMAQAEEMAAKARVEGKFPIVVNELVLRQLNRYLGTEQGREYMRAGISRMEANLTYLKAKSVEYDVPEEIFAVAMAESGYKNYPPGGPFQSAGVWQFIPSTARIFGLQVDDSRDERMDFSASTDAAFRYLKSNHLMLGDWMLAIMGYNIGERKVFEATKQFRTRDVWKLLRMGVKTDPDYMPRVMAMVLILKNPESLR